MLDSSGHKKLQEKQKQAQKHNGFCDSTIRSYLYLHEAFLLLTLFVYIASYIHLYS